MIISPVCESEVVRLNFSIFNWGIYLFSMNREQTCFLELLRVGLWGGSLNTSLFEKDVDWRRVLELAGEQTVIGVVTDAVSLLQTELRGERPVMMQFFARTMALEDENRQMNRFAPFLMTQLEKKGVASLLLKGAGVATCYRQPLHRVVGDIDLLIVDNEQYHKAKTLMGKIAESIEEEDEGRKHSAFSYKGMTIEIHGDFRFAINPQCRKNTRQWKEERIAGTPRSLSEGPLTGATLPSIQFDAVFIFAHMLSHYLGAGGVGLRQVSDWMMFLNRHLEEIDVNVLVGDLEFLGIKHYWEVFGAMAVDELGYPKDRMPLYDERHSKKGRMVLRNIFKTGNFGAKQKEWQLKEGSNPVLKKMVTFAGQVPVYGRNLRLFPKDTLWCFREYVHGALRGYKTKPIEVS